MEICLNIFFDKRRATNFNLTREELFDIDYDDPKERKKNSDVIK
jgi:hypothetical protein